VRVRVSASTSNLGAGFDCVGIAVPLWLHARVAQLGRNTRPAFVRGGTLDALSRRREPDLLYTGFASACAFADRPLPRGLAFSARSDIPIARGLGSSAAALVAGARLADRLLDLGLTDGDIADIGARVEGHCDNVGAAAFGCPVLAVRRGTSRRAHYDVTPFALHTRLRLGFAVPDFTVSTRAARSLLPASVPHSTAVDAAARSAALVVGLTTGNVRLLRAGFDDVLHVPYRRALIPGFEEVVESGVTAGAIGVTLSGSGPTLVCLAPAARVERAVRAMCVRWSQFGISARAFVPADVPVEP
jgi:homoserine kinase